MSEDFFTADDLTGGTEYDFLKEIILSDKDAETKKLHLAQYFFNNNEILYSAYFLFAGCLSIAVGFQCHSLKRL